MSFPSASHQLASPRRSSRLRSSNTCSDVACQASRVCGQGDIEIDLAVARGPRQRPDSGMRRTLRRRQEARPVAQQPGMPDHGLMQGVADNFRNRQDGFDDDVEKHGDLRRPWRDDALERRALAKRAGHVTIPFGRESKNRQLKRNVPGSDLLRAHFPTLIFSKSHVLARNVKRQKGSPVRNKR
jgi:hypothetical protein